MAADMAAEIAEFENLRKQFGATGFEFEEAARTLCEFTVKKYDCSLKLRQDAGGAWVPAGPACFIVRGVNCELEDRGYQKFWYADGKRFPIRVADLKSFHAFDQEVREILGLKSLYNESLGSTCARTVYDRLSGRPDR